MDDERIWSFEESLWVGDRKHYHDLIDDECVMVLPQAPFVFAGVDAKEAVAHTPRWASVTLSDRQVMRPQEGLIVIAYSAQAEREGISPYQASCTTTMRRLGPDEWRVVQHQQTPPLAVPG